MSNETRNILIDGEICTPDKVDPKIHKWIGMFRPPYERRIEMSGWMYHGVDDYYIDLRKEKMQNYMEGYYDIPQYITIKESSISSPVSVPNESTMVNP